jgi:hypothetical protein
VATETGVVLVHQHVVLRGGDQVEPHPSLIDVMSRLEAAEPERTEESHRYGPAAAPRSGPIDPSGSVT